MVQLLPSLVKFPQQEEFAVIGSEFARKGGSQIFNNCIGALDGTHIRIQSNDEAYFNRKQYKSIQMQCLCDHKGKFISICVGLPGSVHDSRVLRYSSLYRQAKYPPTGYYIIGDSGYPCRFKPITLITTFKNPVGPAQNLFNKCHSKARVIIERAFGMLKVRWRTIFTKVLENRIISKMNAIIASCVIMHNICITAGEELHDAEIDALEMRQRGNIADEQDGNNFRERLMRDLCIEKGLAI